MRPGARWGEPIGDEPGEVLEADGTDADLAAVVAAQPGRVVRFRPSPASDLARALGLGPNSPGTSVVTCDALVVTTDVDRRDAGDGGTIHAVNAVVFGVPPDRLRGWHRRRRLHVDVDGRTVGSGRASTVVVANGQFLRGRDLVPSGHPGDGRAEVQVYALSARERRLMRARLAGGDHVPHPRIAEGRARVVTLRWTGRGRRLEVDGRHAGRAREARIVVQQGAVRVLI
jgi:hypothetical protein